MKRAAAGLGLDILNRILTEQRDLYRRGGPPFPENQGGGRQRWSPWPKKTSGKIITNDFNLNKVAGCKASRSLNVNELANALKPVVHAGELMTRQDHQGRQGAGAEVAYLDDGTMIIVDNAQKYQGSECGRIAW